MWQIFGQAWKDGSGTIGRCSPKYKANPDADEVATETEAPTLLLCKLDDGKLTIPGNLRAQWLGDPVRAPEWKDMLRKFDAKWAATLEGRESATESQSTEAPPIQTTSTGGSFDWSTVFPGEPTTIEELVRKHGPPCHTFMFSTELQGCVHDGPTLWVQALADGELASTKPLITFGSGTWLLDAKATTFKQEPHGQSFYIFSKNILRLVAVQSDP